MGILAYGEGKLEHCNVMHRFHFYFVVGLLFTSAVLFHFHARDKRFAEDDVATYLECSSVARELPSIREALSLLQSSSIIEHLDSRFTIFLQTSEQRCLPNNYKIPLMLLFPVVDVFYRFTVFKDSLGIIFPVMKSAWFSLRT